MSDPYLSEIRMLAFGYPPKNWAQCNGQLMSIQQNQALFSLLGTSFGGNGTTTFQLPNLQGRIPIHMSPTYTMGTMGGETAHALTRPEMPQHDHAMKVKQVAADTGQGGPGVHPGPGKCLAQGLAVQGNEAPLPVNLYGSGMPYLEFAPAALGPAGGGQAHENRQPFLAVNFCIALAGSFPSRSASR